MGYRRRDEKGGGGWYRGMEGCSPGGGGVEEEGRYGLRGQA